MALPSDSIEKDPVDALSGIAPIGSSTAEEVGRRVQEIFNAWLLIYFGGNPFTTFDASGNPQSKEFPQCDLMYDKAVPPNPATRPMIHLVLDERNDGPGRRMGGGRKFFNGRWRWSIMVRMPAKAPLEKEDREALSVAEQSPQRYVRRIAADLSWLLNSVETGKLAYKGIGHLRVEQGPKEVPAGGFYLQVITFSAAPGYSVACADP